MRSLPVPFALFLALCSCGEPPEGAELDTGGVHLGLWSFRREPSPDRTVAYDLNGAWAATFTDGAYTVTLAGPERMFGEASTAATVTSAVWVRLLPVPFAGTVDEEWLAGALADDAPDVLALGMQYGPAAPAVMENALQIAGDASYGPLLDGVRVEGSDFNDYLGISWRYPTGTLASPEPTQLRSLDCSGFVRMVFGYRAGLPLVLTPTGAALPRRAIEMAQSAPGVVLVGDAGVQATDFGTLAPGDLLFFDLDPADAAPIDHVGIYLGVDSAGNRRFTSSRKTADGPTMGDAGGMSIIDGTTNLYSRSVRAARRL